MNIANTGASASGSITMNRTKGGRKSSGDSHQQLRRIISLPIFALLVFCFLVYYKGSIVLWLPVPFPSQLTFSMRVVKEEMMLQLTNKSLVRGQNRVRKRGRRQFETLQLSAPAKDFARRVRRFFQAENGTDTLCEIRFFMTWVSSDSPFGDRELLAVESLFKSNPKACLVIISRSMDSEIGVNMLHPFSQMGFRVIPVSPDYMFLSKNTPAESWFQKLRQGDINPGRIPLGQNISNLLRLALLYKFGGVYLDTDVIVLKNFSRLRNVIGAQTLNTETKSWTRLNNAVMIFDKKHPLLLDFIQEFALTFNGNKWGHNGPYLVSRVVSRLIEKNRKQQSLTVLPPQVFYPVDWRRISSFFEEPRDENHSIWLSEKLMEVYSESFTIHLWNRQSKMLRIQDGSIIGHIVADYCIFCRNNLGVPAM